MKLYIEKTTKQYRKILFIQDDINGTYPELDTSTQQRIGDVYDTVIKDNASNTCNMPIWDSLDKKIVEYEEVVPLPMAKNSKITELKDKAKQELSQSDYVVIRVYESKLDDPDYVLTEEETLSVNERKNIRTHYNQLKTQVTAATSLAEVRAITW